MAGAAPDSRNCSGGPQPIPGPQLCHVFVFVDPEGAEVRALEAAGLCASFRRRHPGQGTANLCYCFDNAYLELLWVENASEIAAPGLARTGLAGRSRWRETGASPFGIAVRLVPPDAPLPFASWDYTPPYLPAGMSIPVAEASADPAVPFLFRSPGGARPDAWTDGRAGARQAAAGLAEIARVRLVLPPRAAAAVDWPTLRPAGVTVAVAPADALPRMLLTLTPSAGGQPRVLSLPDGGWEEDSGAG